MEKNNFKADCHTMQTNASSSLHSSKLKTIELNDQKAGMSGLDKGHINKIIYDISKGTPYFLYQQKRQQRIDSKIQEIMTLFRNISESQKSLAKKKMDMLAAQMESERKYCHIIVHFDMDAFFAAVEIRDNPSLKNKAVAVGSNYMLSTSNYEARKFGVRAAMPGFIAKRLCPHLVIVPVNYDKYRKVSNEVFAILRSYDPDFLPMSLDEAYVDLSDYMKQHCTEHEESSKEISSCCWEVSKEFDFARNMIDNVVKEIREKIFETTGLTVSAGIAPNMMLAKICSDRNKPNGQFRIPPGTKEIQNFISALPVRKISGIGPVQEQILRSLEIITCKDLWEKRDIISLLFTSTTSNFYLRVALGLGHSELKSDSERKSRSVEVTFQCLSTAEELYEKCQQLCTELCKDLRASHIKGKVVVLKIKTIDYDVRTRNMSLLCHTSDNEIIFKAAKSLLDTEIKSQQPYPLQLRLMGVRVCNLIEANSLENGRKTQQPTIFQSLKNFSQHNVDHSDLSNSAFVCPVCNQPQSSKDLEIFNSHLDSCLRKNGEAKISEDLEETDLLSENYLSKREDGISESNYSNDESRFQQSQSSPGDCSLSSHCKETLVTNDSGICSDNLSYEFLNNINDSKCGIQEDEGDCSDSAYGVRVDVEKLELDNSKMICPICSNSSSQDLQQLNNHIDICLNKPVVKELLSQPIAEGGEKRKPLSSQSSHSAKKLKTVNKSCRKINEFFISTDTSN